MNASNSAVSRSSRAMDPIFDPDTAIPLGAPFVREHPTAGADPSPSRPYGLRYAVAAPHPVTVDMSAVRYDAHRQVCVDRTGSPVFGRHTDGQTNTKTSDGHQGMDSDTDHRED